MLLIIFFPSGLGAHTALAWVIWARGEAFILDNLTRSVGFGKLLFFAVALGFSRGLGLVQASCVTLLSAGLMSQSRSCCCDNYGVVKPSLIRADRFMAIARVVASAAQLQWLPPDRSGRATALLHCSMTQQYFVPLFVNLQNCLTEVLVFLQMEKPRHKGQVTHVRSWTEAVALQLRCLFPICCTFHLWYIGIQ